MGVAHVSSGMSVFMDYWQNQIQQGRQDLRQLSNSLKSGDLTAAQQAFADLRQVTPGFGSTDTATGPADAVAAAASESGANSAAAAAAAKDPREVVKSDVAALGTALQSGDLAGAKTAFAKLQQDMAALQHGHRRHGHHHDRGGKTASGVATSAPSQPPISTTPPSSTAASAVKDADGDHDGTKTFFGVDLKA